MNEPACAVCVSMIASNIRYVREASGGGNGQFATIDRIPYYLKDNIVLHENNSLELVRLKADTLVAGTYVCCYHVDEILKMERKAKLQ